ncbi:odorant receptor 94a-like [Cardiocondyla obscurior]|uniref:odorant receptor 94a-like n=1 Tax=Cardiocondyla obscurior TaxID=286306 RepID=UPI0039658963
MICIETQFFSLNRILLLCIGLWPHQQSRITRFQFIFLFVILLTGIIFQVKKLLLDLQCICDELKDKNEIAIMEKYGYIAKNYTVALIGNTFTFSCIIMLTRLSLKIIFISFHLKIINKYIYIFLFLLVIGIFATCVIFTAQFYITYENILLKNVTTRHRLPFETEYFVNLNSYFFIILLHMDVAICIGVAAMISTGTILITCFTIFCGMFKISCYRIERAVKINILQNVALKNKISKSEELILAINIHRQVITSVPILYLSKNFLAKFEIMFFLLAQIFVVSLCFNFVQIFQIFVDQMSFKESIMSFVFIVGNILYLFISNFLGQNITDHNNYVFNTVYRVNWYETPLQIQRMMLFLLLKGAKNFTMNVGGLFVPSLECFATVSNVF